MTENALEPEVVKLEIAEYNATAIGLNDLKLRMKDVTYDLTTTSGMESAKSDRRELKTLRINLEAKRVELKAPALKRSRAIDGEAKGIDTEIRALEEPIDSQIKAVEAEAKRVKEAKLNETREKVRLILERIEKLKNLPEVYALQTADKIDEVIHSIENTVIDTAGFGDYVLLAKEAFDLTMSQMIVLREEAIEKEKVAAQVETDRLAEVERLRVANEDLEKRQKAFDDEQAEAKRIAGIKAKIEEVFGPVAMQSAAAMNSEGLNENIRALEEEVCPDDIFFDLTDEANGRRLDFIVYIKTILVDVEAKESDARKVEDDRVAAQKQKDDDDRADRDRLAREAEESEKKRKEAVAAEKKAKRDIKIAAAKAKTASEAFANILTVINSDEKNDASKLDEISIIAEANI